MTNMGRKIGYVMTAATKRKISETRKRRGHKPDEKYMFKKGCVPWNKGKTKETDIRLAETGRKIGKALLGKPSWRKGKPLTEEHKRKISESLNGKKLSEEHRKKLSESHKGQIPWMKGKHHSEETKKKISMANKGKNRSDEFRKRVSKTLMGCTRSKETKEKMRHTRLNRRFKQKDTSIERALQEELNKNNLIYEKHISVCEICQPDLVFPLEKVAVFADGDYWHSKEFKDGLVWRRDRNQDKTLRENGWTVFRFWGHEIKADVSKCVDDIMGVL